MGCYCSTSITNEEYIYKLIKSYSFSIVKDSQIKDIYDYIVSKSESYILTNKQMTTKRKKYILYKDFSLIHITKYKSDSFISILNKDNYLSVVYRLLLSTSLPYKTNSIMISYFNKLYDKIPYNIKYPILKTILIMIICPINHDVVYKKYMFDCIYYLSIYYHMNLIDLSEAYTYDNTMKDFIKTYSQTENNIYNTNNTYKNNDHNTNTNTEHTKDNTDINLINNNSFYINPYKKTYNFPTEKSNSNQILLHNIINKKIIHKDILVYLLKIYISIISADSLVFFIDVYCASSDKNKDEAVSSFKNHWNQDFIEEFIENRLINTSLLCFIRDFPQNEFVFIEKFIANSLYLVISFNIYDDMLCYYNEKYMSI